MSIRSISREPIAKRKVNKKKTIYEKLNTCRLCLIDRAVHNIFLENFPIFDEVLTYCKIQPFKNDGLPEHVCKFCLRTSERVVKFFKQCEENDRLLRENLKPTIDRSNAIAVKSEPKEFKEDPDDNSGYTESLTFENSFSKKKILNLYQDEISIDVKQIKLEKNTTRDEKESKLPLASNFHTKLTDISLENKLEPIKVKLKTKRNKNSDKTSKLCPICGKSFGHSKTYYHHMKLHSGETFACPLCAKTFPTKAQMDQHHKLHFPPKMSPCQICGKSYISRNLKRHMIVYHERKQRINCEICNKTLNTATSYKVHMQVHRGEKKYECDICKTKFIQKAVLMIHIRTHTGEKPYSCSFCENRFASRKSMQRHTRLHTGERPYVCPVCTKGFMQSSNLKSHVKNNHKDFNLKKLRGMNMI